MKSGKTSCIFGAQATISLEIHVNFVINGGICLSGSTNV
jgi:hypothetical protein